MSSPMMVTPLAVSREITEWPHPYSSYGKAEIYLFVLKIGYLIETKNEDTWAMYMLCVQVLVVTEFFST